MAIKLRAYQQKALEDLRKMKKFYISPPVMSQINLGVLDKMKDIQKFQGVNGDLPDDDMENEDQP